MNFDKTLTICVATVLILAVGTAGAQPESVKGVLKKLDHTTWCAESTHTRLDLDFQGNINTKEGKNICLVFDRHEDQLVAKITWWNELKGIHVVEWAIVSPVTPSRLEYMETEQPAGSGFPGIAGGGTLILAGKQMHMTQLGHLADGSAAGFTTRLVQVAGMPTISVPQTYPPLP